MIIFFSELINYLSLSLIYSSIPEGGTTVALLHHSGSNTILHSPHSSTRQHKLADMPNILQSAHSLIHSLLLFLRHSSVPLCHCLAMPCTNISIFLPACLSRPLGSSHFHSYYALFCFHAGSVGGWSHRWRDDFMLQQQQKREEQATTSLRAYLSLN